MALVWSRPIAAAPVWLPLQRLDASVEKRGDPRVAVNNAGRAVSVFERYDGTVHVIRAAVRLTPLGAWTVQTISPPGGEAFNPQVALDRAGRAVVVWQQFDGAQQRIRGITGTGTRWGEVQTLSDFGAFDARIAGNDSGNVVAAWQRHNGAHFVMQAARNVGGSWSATESLSPPGENAVRARVAVDAAGNAVVGWNSEQGGTSTVRAAVSAAGGAWSAPLTLSGPGSTELDVAIGGGEALAVWRRALGSDSVVEIVGWRVGSSPPAAQALSQSGQRGDQPDVDVTANGRAVAAWRAFDGRNFVATAAIRPAGGGFEAPRALAQAREDSIGPRVAIDASGNAVVLWVRSDGTNGILQSATRLARAAAWLPSANVTPPGGDVETPQITVAGGRGIATFVRSAGSQWVWTAVDYLTQAPVRGFVSRAYVAAFRGGPPVTRLNGRRSQIWAYFVFLVQPARGQRITVTWIAPGGKVVGSVGKARARRIETSVVGQGGVFPPGIWRAVLRVGGVVVKQASVRIG